MLIEHGTRRSGALLGEFFAMLGAPVERLDARFRLCGEAAKLRAFLTDGAGRRASGRTVNAVSLALASTYLGDRAAMYRWIDFGVESGDWMLFYINIDREFDPYRQEPRFRALMERAGMPSP